MHVRLTLTVGAGDLTVGSLGSGSGTRGLDRMTATAMLPISFAAGTSTEFDVSARLIGAPGSTGNRLEITVAGRVGTGPIESRTVDTSAITSTEAVTGALSATKPAAGRQRSSPRATGSGTRWR
ncbi:MAG TPA: hypothetical protein VGJ28_09120 [Micromonosporaceae bacterium]